LISQNAESQLGKIDKGEALQSLRVLTYVAKNDSARHQAPIYEPFLTRMINEDVANPVVSIPKTSRLLA